MRTSGITGWVLAVASFFIRDGSTAKKSSGTDGKSVFAIPTDSDGRALIGSGGFASSIEFEGRLYFSAYTSIGSDTDIELYSFGESGPAITCPANVSADLTSGTSVAVTFGTATATDKQGTPVITYSNSSGDAFPAGATTVTATATTTETGKTATCTFKVTVNDKVAPTITCPADVKGESPTATSMVMEYDAATATDNYSSATVTYDIAAGSTFKLAEAVVTETAKDVAAATHCTHMFRPAWAVTQKMAKRSRPGPSPSRRAWWWIRPRRRCRRRPARSPVDCAARSTAPIARR